MRARLVMKLMGIVVILALTLISAHSCSSSPPSSPLDPATLAHNGLSGLCANQAATAAATGDGSAPTLVIPQENGLPGMAAAAGLAPGSYSCPTTTVAGGG